MTEFKVEKADTRAKYEGLRDLWVRVFGDEPALVDHVYRVFGADITGYVICNEAGKVVSVLTCYKAGTLMTQEVYVSYAVCTDPEYRGRGLGGQLTEYVKNVVTAGPDGGISLVSPAEESLIAFYKKLGYEETCFASEQEAFA